MTAFINLYLIFMQVLTLNSGCVTLREKREAEGFMEAKIEEMFESFGIDGKIKDYKIFKSGHINTTCKVTIENDGVEKDYVLQKINKNVFKEPEEVMENIKGVTYFIKRKLINAGISPNRRVLNFMKTPFGDYYSLDENGDYWRIYEFIDKSVTFDSTNSLAVLRETGKAFGEFQRQLADYPSYTLFDIIPDFHNTPKRFETFKKTITADPARRVGEVSDEIVRFLLLEEKASIMQNMLDRGALPLRVTHNDTKCNNVLFDEDTHKHICVIDLDTVMPGLVGHDFGDAIRFAGNTSAEDETDLSKVKIDLEKFRAFTEGFLSEVGASLTENELKTLSLGAITMTTECGVRFLTDYIDGDNYFGISYPKHNLDRARCQLALAEDMVRNYDKMQEIVMESANKSQKV